MIRNIESTPTPQEVIQTIERLPLQVVEDNIENISQSLGEDFEEFKNRRRKAKEDPNSIYYRKGFNLDEFKEQVTELKEVYQENQIATTELERSLVEIHTDLPAILERGRHRRQLRGLWNDLERMGNRSGLERIKQETAQLNEQDAAWQAKVGELLILSERIPALREAVEKFWINFDFFHQENNLKQTGATLRHGVIGPVTTLHLMNELGYKGWFAHPVQDARDGIDIWAVPNEVNLGLAHEWRRLVLAVQVKTSDQPFTNIKVERLLSKPDTNWLRGREKRVGENKARLFTNAQRYGKIHKAHMEPIWVDLENQFGEEIGIDPATGKPTPEFVEVVKGSEVKRLFEKLKGGR